MEQIGGMYVVGASEEHISLMRGREAFIKQYCTERGWDMDTLDMIKVLEIRKQDGWKTPGHNVI